MPAAHLRLIGMPGMRLSSVQLLAFRSQTLCRFTNRARRIGSFSGARARGRPLLA